jgi:hypothetical protein
MVIIQKNAKRNWIVFTTTLLIIPLAFIACAQSPSDANNNDVYTYPIKPGTDEWKTFTTHDEMLEACQIPESILEVMSTKGLVVTVLEYPLYGDIMAYNSIQQGFNKVAAQFNGLSELLNRKDAGVELLAKYRNMNPADIEADWSLVQKGSYAVKIGNIEILLAQDSILSNFTETQLLELIQVTREKYLVKQQLAEIYGQSGKERSVWLMGKVLQQVGYPPFEQQIRLDMSLQYFIGGGSFANDVVSNEIISHAEQFLSGK